MRTRPGDRPAWRRLQADDEELGQLRSAADDARLPVDVVGALLVEWGLCEALLGDVGVATVQKWAELALAEARLAPIDDLRAWDQLLAGRGPISAGDELPELCLPQRLAVRLPIVLPAAALQLAYLQHATRCDRAACRLGMTMETWLLSQALQHADWKALPRAASPSQSAHDDEHVLDRGPARPPASRAPTR